MSPAPLLTIVSVTYKDEAGLKRTLDSLAGIENLRKSVELIVIDGGSGGDVARLLGDHPSPTRWISEPDDGIYDAMNKGINLARGHFVWFLNGGDESRVSDWSAFLAALAIYPMALLAFDYELSDGSRHQLRRSRPSWYIRHGLPTSHQALLYPREAMGGMLYDTSFRVTGDYDLTARLISAGVPLLRVKGAIARFALGGTSHQAGAQLSREARRVQRETLRLSPASVFASQLLHSIARMRRQGFGKRDSS